MRLSKRRGYAAGTVRLGVFHQQLVDWAEKPCILTVTVGSGSQLRMTGILRAYYSLQSFRGWTLVPPTQHGGFATAQLTQLNIEDMTWRHVVGEGSERRLRFSTGIEPVFELTRDPAFFTGPPRSVGTGRYLYIGGRRRPRPEPWMIR